MSDVDAPGNITAWARLSFRSGTTVPYPRAVMERYPRYELNEKGHLQIHGDPFMCFLLDPTTKANLQHVKDTGDSEETHVRFRNVIAEYFCLGAKQAYDLALNHGYAIARAEIALDEDAIFQRGRTEGIREGRAQMRREIMNAVGEKND